MSPKAQSSHLLFQSFAYVGSLTALCLAFASGCSSELDGKTQAKVEAAPAKSEAKAEAPVDRTLNLVAEQSSVGFVGAKITGDHSGGFRKISGSAKLAKGQPVALNIEIDATSIYSDNDKLTSHLSSKDFLAVEQFPKATFTSDSLKADSSGGGTHQVSGTLDMHGVKKTIAFPATIKLNGDVATGDAEFKINRKDFGITYPGRPDDLIKDEVLLKLKLEFKA